MSEARRRAEDVLRLSDDYQRRYGSCYLPEHLVVEMQGTLRSLLAEPEALRDVVEIERQGQRSMARALSEIHRLSDLSVAINLAPPPPDAAPEGNGRVPVTVSRRADDKETMSFDGTTFTTVRPCCDCGVLICGGPTRCLYCAAKLPTSAPGAECTGIAASWCPVHGNCSCLRDEEGARTENRSGVDCPLHGLASNHGDAEVSALAAKGGA